MKPVSLAAATIFLGSFLLFGIQPLLGRTLLPLFGGTAAVWIVCLAAYQTLLMAGYFYAHHLARRPRRVQQRWHAGLLALAAAWLAVFAWQRAALTAGVGASARPALEVLLCVLLFAGLPYVLLAAGSTLVQTWQADRGRGVYRLYAVSNLGSFLGLFAYPFLLEPLVPLTAQWRLFTLGLAVYAALLAILAGRTSAGADRPAEGSDGGAAGLSTEGGRPGIQWLWFAIPGLSVLLLNATTAHLTLDVMPLPLLWVVLLGAFLLSYVFGFSGRSGRWLWIAEVLAIGAALLGGLVLSRRPGPGAFLLDLGIGLVLCLAGCTFLHGWLYRLRPSPARLTRYYLGNAAGGACGGLLASLAAPVVFTRVGEYPLALLGLVAMAGAIRFQLTKAAGRGLRIYAPLTLALAVILGYHWLAEDARGARVVVRDRGFFGTVKVIERPAMLNGATGVVRDFLHGTTVHGIQALIPGSERRPTAYFTPDAGGVAILQHPKRRTGEPMRVGVLGMGSGVLASYARSNDLYRCYEISPEVIELVRSPSPVFTFVSGAPGTVEIVTGDARKALAREEAANEPDYDVLYVDAFTGDNLPYHLSTREAFDLYFRRLRPDGILAVNISNWHLDLTPLIKAVGDAFACPVVAIRQEDSLGQLRLSSMWAFFVRQPPPDFRLPTGAKRLDFGQVKRFKLPTDERGSFVGLVSWPWSR